MKIISRIIITYCLLLISTPLLSAKENTPWGVAGVLDITYKPQKVLYDLSSGNKNDLISVLDRISYLNKIYQADTFDSSIIVVVHGNAIPFFTIDNFNKHEEMIRRAQSLSLGTPIEFRMCRAAARLLGYEPRDIHGFVKMVPMADAEIVRLQHEGYAYMR